MVLHSKGLELIKEFSSSDDTVARPENATLLEMYANGKPHGFSIGAGPDCWREQRRFALRSLKDVMGGKTGMEARIDNEVSCLIAEINKRIVSNGSSNTLTNMDRFFEMPMINLIWETVASKRYDYDDPTPKRQFDLLKTFMSQKWAGPLTLAKFLKLVPPFKQIYIDIKRSMEDFRIYLRKTIQEQRKSFDEHNIRGYIDKFIQAEKEGKGHYFNDMELVFNLQVRRHYNFNDSLQPIILLQDLFVAGGETASSLLASLILNIVKYPDVQAKIQEELDSHYKVFI